MKDGENRMADRITIQESPWARTASDITQMMLQMQMLKMQNKQIYCKELHKV